MKISKQARRDGKALLRSCLHLGQLDEARARAAVKDLLVAKPRGYLAILGHFQRLLKLYLDNRRTRVENAVETPPALQQAIRADLERRYGPGLDVTFAVNPELLGGLKVRVGSDVYDGSVQARLADLKTRF